MVSKGKDEMIPKNYIYIIHVNLLVTVQHGIRNMYEKKSKVKKKTPYFKVRLCVYCKFCVLILYNQCLRKKEKMFM